MKRNFQSDSTYVPIKTGHVSGTESDDSGIKSVRFSKLAEVKEMSPHEATEALLSRLSYTASLRIRRQKTNHKTARTALMFCILVGHVKFENLVMTMTIVFSFYFLHSGLWPTICFNWRSNPMRRPWLLCSVQHPHFSHWCWPHFSHRQLVINLHCPNS